MQRLYVFRLPLLPPSIHNKFRLVCLFLFLAGAIPLIAQACAHSPPWDRLEDGDGATRGRLADIAADVNNTLPSGRLPLLPALSFTSPPSHEIKLANGLKIFLIPDPSFAVISYQTWFHVGSFHETPHTRGAAHLLESLFFAAPDSSLLVKQVQAAGGGVNAVITRDYSLFYQNFPPALLPQVIAHEAKRMTSLEISEPALKNELLLSLTRQQLKFEHAPELTYQDLLWQLAFKLHPYHWPIQGTPEQLVQLQRQDLIDFYHRYYQPANATVVVVGPFTLDSTAETLTACYSAVTRPPPAPLHEVPQEARIMMTEPLQSEERRLIIRPPGHVAPFSRSGQNPNSSANRRTAPRAASAPNQQAGSPPVEQFVEQFFEGYPIPSGLNPRESSLLDLLSTLMFDGPTSRLGQRTLGDHAAPLQALTALAYTPRFPGLLMIHGVMRQATGTLDEYERLRDQVVREVQSASVTEAELERAIRQMILQHLSERQQAFDLGQMMGALETLFSQPKRFYQELVPYAQVTREAIQKAANRYLDPNHRSLIIVCPVTKAHAR